MIKFPKPKFIIDDSVLFSDQNGVVAVMGRVTGARYQDGEWHYTVHSESAKGEPDLFDAIENQLVSAT